MNNLSLIEKNDSLALLKATICKGVTDDEFKIFLHACVRTGLDPFMKQIYAVKRFESGREVMTIQMGIDGFRLIAERTNKYAPGKEPSFAYNEKGDLVSATAYVRKQTTDGTWHEVSATAFYSEYVQRKKDGTPTKFWSQMPFNQLAKCAEALALRKSFPANLSGIYTHEEMAQAGEAQFEMIEKKPDEPPDSKKDDFLAHFAPEEHEMIEKYLQKYVEHFKGKTINQAIEDYSDLEKFKSHFSKWKAKQ